tara:strand:- start:2203 stop:2700 length:498 start_codon:yes stop_codon:yes gene_type:complete
MAKKTAFRGISRIDSGSTHGYFVRGYRNGKTYSKLFSDRKTGGKGKALVAAKEYRDDLHEQMASIPKQERAPRVVTADARNTTGELGVSRCSKLMSNGLKHECYTVSWRPSPNTQRSTSFSVKKHGEKGAFNKAVAHRRKMMKEIHGADYYRKLAVLKRKRDAAK